MTVQGSWGFQGQRFATDDRLQGRVGPESAPSPLMFANRRQLLPDKLANRFC